MHVCLYLCDVRKSDIVVSSVSVFAAGAGGDWLMLHVYVLSLFIDNGAICKYCDIESVKCGK